MKRSFIVTLALATVLPLVGADGDLAKLFSGSTAFQGIGGILPGGGVTCIGGEPNPKAPWPLCTPSTTSTRIRGVILKTQGTSTDAPITGIRTTIFNGNLDKDGRGPIWGTVRIEVNDPVSGARWGCGALAQSCAWEGVYTGAMASFGPFEVDAVAYGAQGAIEGMKLMVHSVGDLAWNETMNGYYYPAPKK